MEYLAQTFLDTTTFSFFRDFLGYGSLVAGAVLILMSRVKTDNLNDLKERVDILETERTELRTLLTSERETARTQHLANQKAISKLEGQVQLYKDLQLTSISQSLELLSKSNQETSKSNQQILNTLNNSAIIAKAEADGGGVLVKNKADNPLAVKLKEE